MNRCNYVLITTAKNEERYIEQTITSVLRQNIRPWKWIIVSDASTDATDQIIQEYAQADHLIEYIRIENHHSRSFWSKAYAFREGYQKIQHLQYDLIGNLDADVSFLPDYYERLIGYFIKEPSLGIAGGQLYEWHNHNYIKLKNHNASVSGAVQLFRRSCFEEIGGYLPLRYGGIDSAAEIMARNRSWKTKTISELHVVHHRPMGSESQNLFSLYYRQGIQDYLLGYHPLFFIGRCTLRCFDYPCFISSLLRIVGYSMGKVFYCKPDLPNHAVQFLHKEQMQRIKFWSS